MTLSSIPSLLNILASLGLAIFIFSRKPKRAANIGFTLGMFFIALMEFGNFMALRIASPANLIYWKRVSIVGEAFIPGSWLLFSLTFARSNYKEILLKWRPIVAITFIAPIFFLAFIGTNLFIFLPKDPEALLRFLGIGSIGYFYNIFLLLVLVMVIMTLENTLRSASTVNRSQIKFMVLGVGAFSAFHLYIISQNLLVSSINIDYTTVHSTIITLSCMIITLSVVKYRLLDVDIFISRHVIYNSLTILITGAYLLVVGILAQGIKYLGGKYDLFLSTLFIFCAMAGLLVLFLSDRMRRKTKLFINRHFYKHKYDFKGKWMEVTEKISAKSRLDDLGTAILELLSDTLGVKDVSIWLCNEEGDYFIFTGSNSGDVPTKIERSNSLVKYLKESGSVFNTEDITTDTNHTEIHDKNREFFTKQKAVLFVPLIVDGSLIGFFNIGRDTVSDQPYVEDDLDLLTAVAKQSASQIANIRLSERLVAAKEAEAFHNVTSFFVHDLKNFTNTLSLLAQNAKKHYDNPDFRKESAKVLSDTVTRINNLIRNLKTVSSSLTLCCKKVDFNNIIEEIITSLHYVLKEISVEKRFDNLPLMDLDRQQIGKVIHNLLLNAKEATSTGDKIEVITEKRDNWIALSVIDNGQGIPKEFIHNGLFKPFKTTKSDGLGIGLFQSKKIIEAHGGMIEVESKVGKGTRFTVRLPINVV